MKIGIDIRPLRDVKTGIGRYILSLVSALGDADAANDYVMFYNGFGPKVPHGLPVKTNIRLAAFHWPRKLLTATWAYAEYPKVEKFIRGIDVFHSPGHQVPPSQKPASVFTIHDLIPLVHPEMAIPSSVMHTRPRIGHYANRSDVIVAVSKATAADIVRLLNVAPEKVVTVYSGTTPLMKASSQDMSVMRRKFNLRGHYMLFVGRVDPRKNLPRLMRAFEISGLSGDFELVVAGPKGWHMKGFFATWNSLKCRDRIRWLDYVDENDLSALYSGASFLAFVSVMEGFGLPILEAMSVGCPVLTSNVSSMPEVGGDAALYVDPFIEESISEGIVKLAGDSSLRAGLIAKGIERTKLFTWENTAKEMVGVYKRACDLHRERGRRR